jgi:ubiquitin-protein ligase
MSAASRLRKDLAAFVSDPSPYFSVQADDTNLFKLSCTIMPHRDSSFGRKVFNLEMIIDRHYPITAPEIRFLERVKHDCIGSDGRIDLRKDWSPAFTIHSLLLVLCAMFNDYDETKARQVERVGLIKLELLERVWRQPSEYLLSME